MSLFKKLFGKSDDKTSDENINTDDFSSLTKTDFKGFNDLVNQNAGLSFEKQLNFNELTGKHAWNINLNTATLSFGPVDLPFEVIGSLSFNDYSWMWGWANTKSGIPENLLESSLSLKTLGEQKQISEFTEAHFNVDEGFEHKMGIVACGLLKADAYFCANYGQGTMVVTVKSDQIQKVDKNQLEKVPTTFPQVISAFDLDHKEAFKNYLIDRHFELNISDRKIEGLRNGKLITAEFDDLNRLLGLNANL